MLTTILNIVNSLCLGLLHISPLLPVMVSKHQYACNAFIFIKCHNLTSNSLQIYLYSHRLFSTIRAKYCNSQKTDSPTTIVEISQKWYQLLKSSIWIVTTLIKQNWVLSYISYLLDRPNPQYYVRFVPKFNMFISASFLAEHSWTKSQT